mmetsp:Transcript_11968/g.34296  ORF Transcript_11968/g.34296 Transcript_11968/m.34296 type:complete len:140 (+) Transcript_11968:398-817(+)
MHSLLDIVLLTVKEEQGHGEGGEDNTDQGNHNGGEVCGSEILSDVAGVGGEFLSGERGIDSHGKKKSGRGSDGRKDLFGNNRDGGGFLGLGSSGHQLRSGHRRCGDGLEAVDSLQGDNKNRQSSEEFHLGGIELIIRMC